VRVEKAGFRTMSRSGVVLNDEQVARLDFILEIGAISETIDVAAATPLREASTSPLGQGIDSRQFTDLPLNNRRALGLLGLSDNVNFGRNFNPDVFVSDQRDQDHQRTFDGGRGGHPRGEDSAGPGHRRQWHGTTSIAISPKVRMR
jgi:hypothetical protein